MFKKILSTALCLSMLISSAIPAFAADITTEGAAGQTVVSYGMSESFTVIIPGDFVINGGTATANVIAEDVMIGANKSLAVTISGDDYVDKWELIDREEDSNRLEYTIGSYSGGNDIVNESIVLLVNAGEAYDSAVSETLYFTVVDTLTKSGTYEDILTFTAYVDASALLEGSGQTFHRMAPAPLTFRSQEPLDEFQEVLIDGQPVDPSHYTLTEGSTIVTLNVDYLQSLATDNHRIEIVSENKTPSGSFRIIEPQENEYNFYYNQPYTGYVEIMDEKCAFFMHEDNTMELLCVGPISTSVIPANYEVEDDKLLITSDLGNFTGVIAENAQSIYCEELGVNFVIGDETIVADEEYIYTLNEYNGGYRATVIDRTKTSYNTVKMGIHGIPTTNLESTYRDCVNLVVPPVIPYGIDNMDTAFGGCTSLKVAPVIPDSVTGMIAAFADCISLEKAPVIPAGVVDLSSTFIRCYSLKGVIEINTNDIDINNGNAYLGCFSDTVEEIIITGEASDEIKAVLAGTAENGNVHY